MPWWMKSSWRFLDNEPGGEGSLGTGDADKGGEGESRGKLEGEGLGDTEKVVDHGKEEVLSRAEVIERAQRVTNSDRRLREAADMRKGAERAMTAMDLLKRANAGDEDALRKLPPFSDLTGIGQEHVDNTLRAWKATEATDKGKGKDKPPEAITRERLSPELQSELDLAQKERAAKNEALVKEKLGGVLDKDDVLGETVRKNSAMRERAVEFTKDALLRRAKERGPNARPGPQDLHEAVQETRKWASDLRLVGRAGEDQDVPAGSKRIRVGLPKSPGLATSSLHREEGPMKRPPSGSAEYSDWLMQEFARMQATGESDN